MYTVRSIRPFKNDQCIWIKMFEKDTGKSLQVRYYATYS